MYDVCKWHDMPAVLVVMASGLHATVQALHILLQQFGTPYQAIQRLAVNVLL